MAVEDKWFKRLTRTAASVLALTVVAPTQSVVAQDSLAQAATADDHDANTKTVFAQFPDLDAKATVQRLAEFQKDPKKAAALKAVSDLLSKPGVKARDLDTVVLPLVEGRKIDDVDISLAAIMRDHYFTYVINDSRNANALIAALEKRDDTLTESAYGATTPRRFSIYRKTRTRR